MSCRIFPPGPLPVASNERPPQDLYCQCWNSHIFLVYFVFFCYLDQGTDTDTVLATQRPSQEGVVRRFVLVVILLLSLSHLEKVR